MADPCRQQSDNNRPDQSPEVQAESPAGFVLAGLIVLVKGALSVLSGIGFCYLMGWLL